MATKEVKEVKTYKDVHEKYEDLVKATRPQRDVSWYMNPDMDTEGAPVLIQIPDAQFKPEDSPWREQGYIKYTPKVKVEPTGKKVDAKAPKADKAVKETIDENSKDLADGDVDTDK